jgi:hypothetical protein
MASLRDASEGEERRMPSYHARARGPPRAGAPAWVPIRATGRGAQRIVLVGAAITVAILDLYSWLESDGSSMAKSANKLNKALSQEFGSDYAPYRGGERYETCRTQEALARLANDLDRVDRLVAASR